jgi:2-amino-4-hydroxy-6-hydroxymethyldihydropteridine diphosphokinase/dihydropteroate synthase
MGREKTIDKGPRNIDLDIALYDDIVYESQELTIPHASMFEREFVLRPLCESVLISPDRCSLTSHSLISQEGPPLAKETRFSIQEGSQEIGPRLSSWSYHNRLDSLAPSASPMSSITPLSSRLPFITAQSPTRDTSIMAVVNLTPDSFSDGGKHDPADQESLSETMRSHISNGATIIDIGGQSTRPHAESVAASEELDRVLPAVKAIRSLPQGQDVCISVDTYRAQVAEAAIAAGADLINDVSAGALDEDMLKTVAKLGCTICLMHMRGTPDTMNSLTDYPEGLIPIIGAELLARVQAAEKAGIRRWRIILDPGIGFAKTAAQNLDILRNLDALRNMEGLQGLPWLVGASRKGFIGKITGVEAPAQRSWGTAAAVTAAVQNGADIVRVHDVAEMAKVVKMADAIWRSGDL